MNTPAIMMTSSSTEPSSFDETEGPIGGADDAKGTGIAESDDDTEGHTRARLDAEGAASDDDAEGHMSRI